jgi:hypothetical protein
MPVTGLSHCLCSFCRDLDINLCMGVTPAAVARLQAKLPLLKGLRPNAAAQLLASNARLL